MIFFSLFSILICILITTDDAQAVIGTPTYLEKVLKTNESEQLDKLCVLIIDDFMSMWKDLKSQDSFKYIIDKTLTAEEKNGLIF